MPADKRTGDALPRPSAPSLTALIAVAVGLALACLLILLVAAQLRG